MKATRFGVVTGGLGIALALGLALRSWDGGVSSGRGSFLRESRGMESARSSARWGRLVPSAPFFQASPTVRLLSASAPSSFHKLEAWIKARQLTATGARAGMTAEGLRLAQERRKEMLALIREDPEKAIEWSLPYEMRQGLPAEILTTLERRVDGMGRFDVLVSCGPEGQGILRKVLVDGEAYSASVFDRRLGMGTKNGIPLHGVALDGSIALDTHPYRILGATEAADHGLAAGGIPAMVGREVHVFDGAEALTRFEGQVKQAEASLGPVAYALGSGTGQVFVQDSTSTVAWTTGQKSLLYIRCRFKGETQDPVTSTDALRDQGNLDVFLRDNSNGRLSVSSVITPVVELPQTRTWYATQEGLPFDRLLQDARSAALAAGYNFQAYDLDVVATARIGGSFASYSGMAYFGDRGVHLNGYFSLRTVGHEIGHNLGLHHANYNNAAGSCPISRVPVAGQSSTWQEYGHLFSVMAGQVSGEMDQGIAHYTVQEKEHLGWLSGAEVVEAASGGVYRIYRHDHISASGLRALKVACSDPDRPWYWLSYRTAYGSRNPWLTQGVLVEWGRTAYDAEGAILLDMTPQSCDGPQDGFLPWEDNNDKEDAALPLGKTYGDPGDRAFFTPVATGGTSPHEYVDVYVWLGSRLPDQPSSVSLQQNPSNAVAGSPVTVSVEGLDRPEGDLAFFWDFGDRAPRPNQRAFTWTAQAPGMQTVRCLVSTMRGGVAELSRTISVRDASTVLLDGEWVVPTGGAAGFFLPDEWKVRFFGADAPGNPRYGAWSDPAQTGMPLWRRFFLGLDPTNRHDRFAVNMDPSGLASEGSPLVRWTSVVGRSYKVQSSDNLKTWTDASGTIVASSRVTEWSDTGVTASGRQKFYRVVVLPP